jgi:glycosyltransferase involved in cell wall biosynthesis
MMRIAVNARFTGYAYAEGYARFTKGVMSAMVRNYPHDEFVFLYDNSEQLPFIKAPNISFTGTGPAARHPLLWKYWYDYVLTRLAKRSAADCLFSPDGFCSLRTKLPQVLAIHDLAFLNYPEGINRLTLEYYKYYTPKFINKAQQIITVSEFSREDIVRHYPKAANKISVVYNAADENFRPATYQEKEKTRESFTDGKEFFLYVGSIHPRKNLVTLLKGFSWFKKRHQSNMKLVLAGRMAWKNDLFLAQLNTYKYRDDIVLTGYLEDDVLRAIIAAAYALVYPSHWEGFGLPLLEAMKSAVPLITSQTSALPEIAGNAAYYADPDNAETWGRGMGLLFKDESYRNELIQHGIDRASFFSWEKSAQSLHDVMVKAVS